MAVPDGLKRRATLGRQRWLQASVLTENREETKKGAVRSVKTSGGSSDQDDTKIKLAPKSADLEELHAKNTRQMRSSL